MEPRDLHSMGFLFRVIQAAIKLLLFADDVVVLASSIPQLQEALNLIWNWVHRRLMKLSIPKCEAMRLARSPKDRVCNDDLPSVYIGTHPILVSGLPSHGCCGPGT